MTQGEPTSEQIEEYLHGILAKIRQDPQYELKQELGRLLMINIDDFTPEQKQRYEELLTVQPKEYLTRTQFFMSNNLNLMDCPGDTPPFQPGDTVECIEDRKPEFYGIAWSKMDKIKIGDKLTVLRVFKSAQEMQWCLQFKGKSFGHSARLFRKVEG